MRKLLLLTIAALMTTCSVMAQLQFGNGWQTGSENVTYTDADVINIHIAGTKQDQYDRLYLSSGSLTAGNASLNLIVCQPPVTGDRFIIFKAPTIDGEFSNLPLIDAGGNLFVLSYEKENGDDVVVLTAVAKLFGLGISTLGAEPLPPDYSYTLNVLAKPTEGGTVAPTQATFSVCDKIDIEATANEGYLFSHWTQEGGAIIASTASPITTATMPTRDVTITANFCKFPEAPTATAATGVSTNTFTTNWTAVPGTVTYTLDVALDDGFSSFVPGYENYEVVGTVSHTVGTLTPTTTYYYRVSATNSCGTSGSSGTVSVTTTFSCGFSFTDPRDGQSYATVQIGTQCWMAENLKYLPAVVGPGTGSDTQPYYYVYDYDGTDVSAAKANINYQTYGALYNWPASLNACPTGWHLPSYDEWNALTTYVSSQPAYLCDGLTAKSLAATTNWSTHTGNCAVGNNLSANNATGFSGLPGGTRGTNGTFGDIGSSGFWWSASKHSTETTAWYRRLKYSDGGLSRATHAYSNGLSVRCLRD